MANRNLSSYGVKSSVIVLLLWLCLSCDAFPIIPLVGNSESTSQKVVRSPQVKQDSLLPLLLKLRLSRHAFIAAKPNIENEQQKISLKRVIRSTDDDVYDDNYIYIPPVSGDESPTEDDSYVYSTTADTSSENDTYVYTTTADP